MNSVFSRFSKRFETPGHNHVSGAVSSFSLTERVLFFFFVTVCTGAALLLLIRVNNSFLTTVPAHGGSLTEGVVGSPRFVNPLLATSDADRDMVALVYSGLMKKNTESKLVPDLAENYSISDDGLTYTFTLRDDARFHNGDKVTVDDVLFTITKAQDPMLKSPKRANWDGIVAEKIDDRTLTLTLPQAYGPFLENTTLGILPKNLWQDTNSDAFSFHQLNTEPVGSGPYRVRKIDRTKAGVPTTYTLKSFAKYTGGEPFIKTLTIKFFPNEESLFQALKGGDVQSGYGLSAEHARTMEMDGERLDRTILPRIFGVFFNQNQAQVFTKEEVRKALDIVLSKDRIVKEVLLGYGTSLNGPLPLSQALPADERSAEERMAEGRTILENAGWEKNEESGVWEKKTKAESLTLSFSLATSDAPELKAVAERIKEDWESFGAVVDLHIYETGDLNQNIIRPRKYDALLFGEIIGWNGDLYPFWHSSQRNDPGLNIALYVNNTADQLLEDARSTSDEIAREEAHNKFADEIAEDHPVVFVYSPEFLYALPKKVKGVELTKITNPSERFDNISQWYIDTERIWNIFIK